MNPLSQGHLLEDELVRFANDENPRRRSARVVAHLERCAACRSRLTAIQETLKEYEEARRLELDPRLPPIEAARAHLQKQLAAARSATPSWRDQLQDRSGLWRTFGLTAACAVAFTVVTVTFQHRPAAVRSAAAPTASAYAPDPHLTPGIVTPTPLAVICSSGLDELTAAVDEGLAREVFRLHGVNDPRPRAYEIDYLIPPELGGATDVKNLWPQPYDVHPWNAYAKDALEDSLLRSVCEGDVSLESAQQAIAKDWIAAYKSHFRAKEPLVEHAGFLKDEPWAPAESY